MPPNRNEISIKGQRFVLVSKREFDRLSKRASNPKPSANIRKHKSQKGRATRRPSANTRPAAKTIKLLEQWATTPDTLGDAYWSSLQSEVAANRFRFRQPSVR